MASIRPSAMAGHFYDKNPDTLEQTISAYFSAIDKDTSIDKTQGNAKAVIAPHAGYRYSGKCAAIAYRAFGAGDDVERVIIIGPAHRMPFYGAALCSADYWETPLGAIKVDKDACYKLGQLNFCHEIDVAHTMEHCIEVHIPFIQKTFPKASIVPILISQANADIVYEMIDQYWQDLTTRIVVSSDLSHYNPDRLAREMDLETAHAIEGLLLEQLNAKRACGFMPIGGLLKAAQQSNKQLMRLHMCNSGDFEAQTNTPKDDNKPVVGYGSWAIYD